MLTRIMPTRVPNQRIHISAIISTLLCLATTSRAFLSIPYNTSYHFGPDGPWQAVSFGLRYPGDSEYATVNVYPGNLYDTVAALYVPTEQACYNDTTGTCASGGTVGTLAYTNGSSWYTYLNHETGYYFYYNGSTAYMDALLPQGIEYPGTIVDVCKIAQVTYPNGRTVAAEVGLAGLGGSPLSRPYNPPLALYSDDITQSNSFGLHIGAAQFDYPGSLIFGGFDRGRVIGPVLSFDAHTAIGLLDITIGVETGGSPFSFDYRENFLTTPDSASVTQPIDSYLKPEYPYIYLPQLTIEALAEHLPITYSDQAGFWLWDTKDPAYEKIITSPAYLGFVFPSLTGNSANETIKVPFRLLNMTLEPSVTGLDTAVPYFPVMRIQVDQNQGLPMILGRAFMQAAFFGTNWNTNVSWLAQAPGPGGNREGLGLDPIDLANSASTLDVQSGDSLFNSSWAGHWTVLSTDNPIDNGGGGLSGGAIAGIVVGAVAILAIIAGIIAFFLIRKRKRNAAAANNPVVYDNDKPGPVYAQYADPNNPQQYQQPPNELDAQQQHHQGFYKPATLQPQVYEADGRGYYSELPGHGPVELPGTVK